MKNNEKVTTKNDMELEKVLTTKLKEFKELNIDKAYLCKFKYPSLMPQNIKYKKLIRVKKGSLTLVKKSMYEKNKKLLEIIEVIDVKEFFEKHKNDLVDYE